VKGRFTYWGENLKKKNEAPGKSPWGKRGKKKKAEDKREKKRAESDGVMERELKNILETKAIETGRGDLLVEKETVDEET